MSVIKVNQDAINERNIDKYLSTITSEAHKETYDELNELFETYELETEVQLIEVVRCQANQATLRVTQKTINNNDQNFHDHISVSGLTLLKQDNRWVISESVMEETYSLEL